MRRVVFDGTGKRAQIKNVTVAGTGEVRCVSSRRLK